MERKAAGETMRQEYAHNRRAATNTHPAPLQIATQGNITPQVAACRPAIDAMTPDDLRVWIGSTRAALQKKMARERAYLDRRAARGTCTPTDEAYEADQLLEADLLAMLDEFEHVTWRMDA
jgi:hypothetical protein